MVAWWWLIVAYIAGVLSVVILDLVTFGGRVDEVIEQACWEAEYGKGRVGSSSEERD